MLEILSGLRLFIPSSLPKLELNVMTFGLETGVGLTFS